MRKVVLLVGLALVGFACADGVGQMLTDAGQMIEDAGTSLQDGSVPPTQAQEVSCNKSTSERRGDAVYTIRWAEFEVDPGVTEVTWCYRGDPNANSPTMRRDYCWHGHAAFYRGTSTGWLQCGQSIDYDDPDSADYDGIDPISITVHR